MRRGGGKKKNTRGLQHFLFQGCADSVVSYSGFLSKVRTDTRQESVYGTAGKFQASITDFGPLFFFFKSVFQSQFKEAAHGCECKRGWRGTTTTSPKVLQPGCVNESSEERGSPVNGGGGKDAAAQ